MKKAHYLLAVLAGLVSGSALASEQTWTIAVDSTVDGTINAQAVDQGVRIHQNQFILSHPTIPEINTSLGHILQGTVNGVTYSTALISFTLYGNDSTYI